jgi:hypothetical protein
LKSTNNIFETYVGIIVSPGHDEILPSATVNVIQYWFDWTLLLKYYIHTCLKFSHQCQTNMSIATAQRTCDPTCSIVGVHNNDTDHHDVVFWTIGLLITLGKESVAISWIVVEFGQNCLAVSSMGYSW